MPNTLEVNKYFFKFNPFGHSHSMAKIFVFLQMIEESLSFRTCVCLSLHGWHWLLCGDVYPE